MLESVKQLKILGISSRSSGTESESADPELFSSKMLKESSPQKQETENQFSNMSSEVWKKWVTEQRQEYSQRVKSQHLIRESGSLSWPTTTARDWKGCGNAMPRKDGKSRMDTLEAIAKYGHPDRNKLNKSGKNQESWPTPNTSDQYNSNIPHDIGRGYLRTEVVMNKKANLEEDVAGHCGKATGKLNPDWVEQLMGLPVGWTDLGSWATESSQLPQPKPSSPSSNG
jgi:hypothetical protein